MIDGTRTWIHQYDAVTRSTHLAVKSQPAIDLRQDHPVQRWQGFTLLAVLAIVTSLSMGHGFLIGPITPGLDPSFVYGYNYAAAHRMAWGRDFVSTYGPYGYLVSTMAVGSLVVSKIVWTLLLEAGLGIAALVYVWAVPELRTGGRLALLAGLVYACAVLSTEYQWFALVVLLLLVGIHGSGWRGLSAFALAALLAGFCALIKLSLGGGAILTLAVACVLTLCPQVMARRAAVALCGTTLGFLAGWVIYGGHFDDIWPFLLTGWEVSRGYSSAMSLAANEWGIGVVSFLVWLVVLVGWALVHSGPRTVLSLAVLAVPLFVAWKHAIVRQDAHVRHLIEFGLLVMLVLLIETSTARPWRRILPVFTVLLIALAIPEYSLPEGWRAYTGEDLVGRLLQPLKFSGVRDLAALGDLTAFRGRLAERSKIALLDDLLPESVRSTIGPSTVDVYPSEIAYVPANGLAWANRPLPASFNTYTPLLDDLNAAFFGSERRPRYLLWHTLPRSDASLLSIDGRHLFWDEPKTLRTILDSYDVLDVGQGIALLSVRARPRFSLKQSLGTVSVAWNVWVSVPHVPGVLLAHVSIERSLAMRAIRAGFRENAIFLSLRLSSGEEVRYRLVPDNAIQGLWLSPFPKSVAELHDLLRTGTGRQVVAVRFSAGRFSRLYGPIGVSWAQLMPQSGKWTGEQ
jgi:hypothetical protein